MNHANDLFSKRNINRNESVIMIILTDACEPGLRESLGVTWPGKRKRIDRDSLDTLKGEIKTRKPGRVIERSEESKSQSRSGKREDM